jgi:hypothetical protein
MKIFLVQFLFALSLSVNGAVFENNATGLLNLYNQYSNDKSIGRDLFEAYLKLYYQKDRLGCLRVACQQNDWGFKLAFFSVFLNPRRSPRVSDSYSYEEMVNDINEMAIRNLLKFYPTNEEKDLYFEEMELLNNQCEEAITKIGNSKHLPRYESQILTIKFLHRNLSYDYDGKTINYDSYFSTLKNIQQFGIYPNFKVHPPQELINICTQFIIYSNIISEQNCTKLFEYQGKEHLKHLAIFFIHSEIREKRDFRKKFSKTPAMIIEDLIDLFTGNVSEKLRLFLQKFLTNSPDYRRHYKLGPNIKSFTQLDELNDTLPRYDDEAYFLWNSRGLSTLEKWLISHPYSDLVVD